MLSSIIIGGVTLPDSTKFPKLEFSEIVLLSEPSVTGRLHNVYQIEPACTDLGVYGTIRFDRKFKFDSILITYAEWVALDAIDGTNCILKFNRDGYSEQYNGNLDCNFFKFDKHNYFDAVMINFTVTSQIPVIPTAPVFSLNPLIPENLIISASIGSIYYTYSALSTPDDPTILSTLYTGVLINVPSGNYKAISHKYGVYSSVTSYTKA